MPGAHIREFSHGGVKYPDIFVFDATMLGLPTDWHEKAIDFAAQNSTPVKVDSYSDSLREIYERDESGAVINPIVFKYAGGTALKREMPWLFSAYHGKLLNLVHEKFGAELKASKFSGENIRMLSTSPGNRIEAHVDEAPVSVLLYPRPAEAGGRLFVTPDTETFGYRNILRAGISIFPETDYGILFRGDNYAHVTERNVGRHDRVMISMSYWPVEAQQA